jgi:hypothetical protein
MPVMVERMLSNMKNCIYYVIYWLERAEICEILSRSSLACGLMNCYKEICKFVVFPNAKFTFLYFVFLD